jgi:hypothetical protein
LLIFSSTAWRPIPGGCSKPGRRRAVTTLLKLAGFTNDPRYVDIAHQAMAQMRPMMAQYSTRWVLASGFRR